jgi:hypothetical protein
MAWITQKKFMEETGLSYKETINRRKAGILGNAVKDGRRWMVDIKEYYENIEKLKENRSVRLKPKKVVSLLHSHHYQGASHD